MLNYNLVNKILNKYWKNQFDNVLFQINHDIEYEITYNIYYKTSTSYLTILNNAFLNKNNSFFRYIFYNEGKYLEFEKAEGKFHKYWSKNGDMQWWMVQKDREITDNLSLNIMRCFNY